MSRLSSASCARGRTFWSLPLPLLLLLPHPRPFSRSTCLRRTTSLVRSSKAGDWEKQERASSMNSTSRSFASASSRKASAEASTGCSPTAAQGHRGPERAHSRCHCAAPPLPAARPPLQDAPAASPGVEASVAVARGTSRPPLPPSAPPPVARRHPLVTVLRPEPAFRPPDGGAPFAHGDRLSSTTG